jgi:hypothetical protein
MVSRPASAYDSFEMCASMRTCNVLFSPWRACVTPRCQALVLLLRRCFHVHSCGICVTRMFLLLLAV